MAGVGFVRSRTQSVQNRAGEKTKYTCDSVKRQIRDVANTLKVINTRENCVERFTPLHHLPEKSAFHHQHQGQGQLGRFLH